MGLNLVSPGTDLNSNSIECDEKELYTRHVNPVWVKLLDVLGMNVQYTRSSGAELYTQDGRTILDCLSGYSVHDTGHNHPHIVAALMAELQSQSPAMVQSNTSGIVRTDARNASFQRQEHSY